MRNTIRGVTVVTALLFAATAAVSAGGRVEPVRPSILVETEWLAAHIDHDNLIVLDTGRPPEQYAAGHVPGARHFGAGLYFQEVDGMQGMFPGPDAVGEALRAVGVNNDSVVVIHDAGNGLWATRLFWTLELLGHEHVAVLNGGIGKWSAEGRPLSDEAPRVSVGTFKPDFRSELVTTGEDLQAVLEEIVVVDARSVGEFEGTDVRAARGGHIPGAVNIDWVLNNTNDEINTFLPLEELAEFYAVELQGRRGRIVTHCQTGVRGAHTYFVLRLLGYEDVAVYDASWVEWGNDDAFPVQRVAN